MVLFSITFPFTQGAQKTDYKRKVEIRAADFPRFKSPISQNAESYNLNMANMISPYCLYADLLNILKIHSQSQCPK